MEHENAHAASEKTSIFVFSLSMSLCQHFESQDSGYMMNDDHVNSDDSDLGCSALGTPAPALQDLLPGPDDVVTLTLGRHRHHERLLDLRQKIYNPSVCHEI